jgi:hypothetical protein
MCSKKTVKRYECNSSSGAIIHYNRLIVIFITYHDLKFEPKFSDYAF